MNKTTNKLIQYDRVRVAKNNKANNQSLENAANYIHDSCDSNVFE